MEPVHQFKLGAQLGLTLFSAFLSSIVGHHTVVNRRFDAVPEECLLPGSRLANFADTRMTALGRVPTFAVQHKFQ